MDGNFIKNISKETNKYAAFYSNLSLSNGKIIVDAENTTGCGPKINDNLVLCGCAQANSKEYVKSYMDEINKSNYFSKAKYEIIYNKNAKTIDLKLFEVTETLKQYLDRISWDLCVIK